jgi:hypothetical protein
MEQKLKVESEKKEQKLISVPSSADSLQNQGKAK